MPGPGWWDGEVLVMIKQSWLRQPGAARTVMVVSRGLLTSDTGHSVSLQTRPVSELDPRGGGGI